MKKILVVIMLSFSVASFSAEMVEYTVHQFEESDTSFQTVRIYSNDKESALIQGSARMIFDFEKETLFILDDSIKTCTKLPMAMVGLFFSGLSGLAVASDSANPTLVKSEKKYEQDGKLYPQFSIHSDDEKIFTVAYDESLDYTVTRKRIDALGSIIESLLGFDIQNTFLKSSSGLPVAIIYYKSGKAKTETILNRFGKGSYEEYFKIPEGYNSEN
ncbi:MAG: hypothetical protein PHW02_06930 [bacterium]|nr:hypothetical protein [bacterium]